MPDAERRRVIERRIHDASLPLYVAWSTESPIYTAAVVIQTIGNEVRVISSRHWKLKPLHACIADMVLLSMQRKWIIRTNITPPDKDVILAAQFEHLRMLSEPAPNISDTVTLTRRLFAVLRIDPDENLDLIEAINSYAPRDEPHGFVINAGHTLSRYFVRALEIFAAWHHAGGLESQEWGPAPDYTLADRARI